MPAAPTVVFDCRWLGIGGPGRTTELALRGLAAVPREGRWVLWGDEAKIAEVAWPDAAVSHVADDPRSLLGQRHLLAIPKGDFHVFMHQGRPLRRLPSATVVYDTIPLRFGSGRLSRELKRVFLKRVAATSQSIVTVSEHSKATIVRDLGVAAERVEIVRFPFDDAFVGRVLALRSSVERVDTALFIGGFLPHKNLPLLLAAFGETQFCREGGRLVLVGATPKQASAMLDRLAHPQRAFVTVLHSCTQPEIDHLYASSLFLVQPSLEEGFGLPAWEAMCCGLPVCVSDGGALPEVTAGFADPFPAASRPAMTAAIDVCAASARAVDVAEARRRSAEVREKAPALADFGLQFAAVVGEHVSAPSRGRWTR